MGSGVQPRLVSPGFRRVSLPTQPQLTGVLTPYLCKAGLVMGSQTYLYPRCGVGAGSRIPAPAHHEDRAAGCVGQLSSTYSQTSVFSKPFRPLPILRNAFYIVIPVHTSVAETGPTCGMHWGVSYPALAILPSSC